MITRARWWLGTVALAAPLALGVRPAPCHEGHCHGDAVCGGGWKDHERKAELASTASADDAEHACEIVTKRLERRTGDGALDACEQLHPCGDCPDGCGGCEQERPWGRLDADSIETAVEPAGEGRWRCAIEATAIYRCRCGHCRPDG